MERATFDKKRDTWRKGVAANKALGGTLAQVAGEHFAAHGDTSYIQDFYGDMRSAGKNYVRSSAFLAWLVAHFPVKLEQNKFVKDQELATKMNWSDEAARAALIAKAAEKPFYDFAPEAVVENYKADTVIVALEKAIKRFENSKHYQPEDEAAKAMLARAKSVVTQLKVPAAA